MSTAVMTARSLELSSFAEKSLKVSAKFWFAVTMIGQLVFAFVMASFYGLTAVRGDYHKWTFTHGFIPGYSMGNAAVVTHLVTAVLIMFSGGVQLVPQLRSRFPVFHRWNGRLYMLAALGLSAAGVYMTWIRGSVGGLTIHMGSTVDAVLIWLCAALALRYAVARDFRAHRRWALRLFMVVSASWFFRIGFFLSFAIFRRPFGFDSVTMTGPFVTFMSFGQFLVPLAFLEIYLRAQNRPGNLRRIAAATAVFVGSLAMIAGLLAVGGAIWAPQVKATFDSRPSITQTLAATIASNGVEAAVQQYHDLKMRVPATYNFDESELNDLGYQLIRTGKLNDAVRILQLNVESYPKSSNVYDSLGEAYADAGNQTLAIVNYQKSLDLNPKNGGAVLMLQKLRGK